MLDDTQPIQFSRAPHMGAQAPLPERIVQARRENLAVLERELDDFLKARGKR